MIWAFGSYLDGIPIFAREGILRSLFEPFLAFGKAFIPWTDVSMGRIIKIDASVSRLDHSLSNSHDRGWERSLRLGGCVPMWRVDLCGQLFSEVQKAWRFLPLISRLSLITN